LGLCILAEELGRALACTPFAPSVYLFCEAVLTAGSLDQQVRLLSPLLEGRGLATGIVGSGGDGLAGGALPTFADGRLRGEVRAVPWGGSARFLLTPATSISGVVACVADLCSGEVTRSGRPVLDAGWPLADLDVVVRAERLGPDGRGAEVLGPVTDRAAVWTAFEALGGAQRCLEEAAAHARERNQFGRPIGSFQAVKHRLADDFVAVELARSHCAYAAWALEYSPDDLPVAAAQARLAALDAYRMVAEDALHVHGGIGFTWEADQHLFLRRAQALESALGGATVWADRLVARIVATGS